MCCQCDGSCNHIGPHSYCAAHGGDRPREWVGPQPTAPALGWECPACHMIYAPTVALCGCRQAWHSSFSMI